MIYKDMMFKYRNTVFVLKKYKCVFLHFVESNNHD